MQYRSTFRVGHLIMNIIEILETFKIDGSIERMLILIANIYQHKQILFCTNAILISVQ